MRFLTVFLSVAGLSFAAEAMGLFAHELNLAAAASLLVLAALVDPALKSRSGRADAGAMAVGFVAAGAGLLLLSMSPPARFFSAALWFWGLDRMARARGAKASCWRALSASSLLFGIYMLVANFSLLGWYTVQAANSWLSSSASALTGAPLVLGPTFSALDVYVLGLLLMLCGCAAGGVRALLRCLAGLMGVLLTCGAYLALFAKIPLWLPAAAELGAGLSAEGMLSALDAQGANFFLQALWSTLYPLHLSWIAGVLVALLAAMALTPAAYAGRAARGGWIAGAAAVAGLLALWALTNVPGASRGPGLKVALYKEGFLNWMVPDHQRYGSRSSGMFGNLPIMMECMGWKGEVVEDLSATALADKDMLVIINQKDPLPEAILQGIYDFVDRGGSLLVLGDHTFWKSEQRLLLNEPLDTSNVRFRFDSADYFIGGWLHSLQYWPTQMTAGLGDQTNESGCVVGASLELQYPASPVIIGRYGYSDKGNNDAKNRGYLGDMNPNPDEILGDVVLVAAQNVGQGRVVVVGDTSGFVNAIQTQTWPFVLRVFHWLGSTGRAALPAWRDGLGLALLGAAALGCVVLLRGRAAVLPLTALTLLAGLAAQSWVLREVHKPGALQGKVALVDLSHVGRHSLEGWRDTAINGVYLNLMREGYFSFGLHDFDRAQIMASKLFISIAPTHPYSAAELEVLQAYMESGGTVLLSAGWEQRAGARTLLDRVEMDVEHHPLGRQTAPVPGAGVEATFWKAWAVRGGETVLSLGDKPVIARKRVGRGQLVLIGDSDYLLNKNLEVEDGAILSNVRFFQWLLGNVLVGGS